MVKIQIICSPSILYDHFLGNIFIVVLENNCLRLASKPQYSFFHKLTLHEHPKTPHAMVATAGKGPRGLHVKMYKPAKVFSKNTSFLGALGVSNPFPNLPQPILLSALGGLGVSTAAPPPPTGVGAATAGLFPNFPAHAGSRNRGAHSPLLRPPSTP